MYYIIYSSEAKAPMGEKEFRYLLQQCHTNNQKRDITGLLLYFNGRFMQIIEGEKENILDLFHIIARDPRHLKVSVLGEGAQTGRNFPDWAMGFKAVSGQENFATPAFIDLNQNELLFNADSASIHPALPHLKNFYNQINFGPEYIQF